MTVLLILFIISWGYAAILDATGDIAGSNVIVIPVNGVIGFSSGFNEGVIPNTIIEKIKKADSSPSVKAIVFDINSPGGTPVASEAIVNAIKAVNKTTVAIIRDLGASGAYWIASATDTIIASKYSMTGSVGVRGSFIDFNGLLERYNMTYERFVGGELKDLGDPLKPVSAAERLIFQDKIDQMHKLFVAEIKENRNLGDSQAIEISSGSFYLGGEAKNLGLIDLLGGDKELEEHLKKTLNITEIHSTRLEDKRSWFDKIPFVRSSLNINPGVTLS